MSFDRPELPGPGHKAHEVETDEALAVDGVEPADGELDGLDRLGGVSEGPVPNPPRRPASSTAATEGEQAEGGSAEADVPAYGQVAEAAEPVDDPAHEDPAKD